MSFAVGSLVKARGREWVVLPESEEDLLVLRPLGGTEDEVASVYLPLEPVEPATFDLPDPTKRGAHNNWQACGYEPSVAGGRPRSRPKLMVADRAYEAGSFRSYLRRRDIRCVIPEFLAMVKVSFMRRYFRTLERFSDNTYFTRSPRNSSPSQFSHAPYVAS